MSPIVVDEKVIAHLGKGGGGALIAFNLADGSEKWRWAGEGPDYGSPVLMTVDGTPQVVVMSEKSIAGIGAADGKCLWTLPFAVQRRAYNAATPIVDGQTVIYTGAKRGTHAVKIEKTGDGFAAKPVWDNTEVATQFNSPVLKDGLLYGLSDGSRLFCLDAKTGKTAWVDETSRGRGGFMALIDAGPVLLALPSNSELIVFKPDGKAYAEVAKVKVAETPTYAHPVIAGNRIFVKAKETLAMAVVE
jgi:outer membrane protein assembly factor BamB